MTIILNSHIVQYSKVQGFACTPQEVMKSSSGIQRWSLDEAEVESPVTKSPETEAVLLNAHKCALSFGALLKVCFYFSSAFGFILTNFY